MVMVEELGSLLLCIGIVIDSFCNFDMGNTPVAPFFWRWAEKRDNFSSSQTEKALNSFLSTHFILFFSFLSSTSTAALWTLHDEALTLSGKQPPRGNQKKPQITCEN